MWSASKSDLRTENYVTYTPSSSVSPVVSYGSNEAEERSTPSVTTRPRGSPVAMTKPL